MTALASTLNLNSLASVSPSMNDRVGIAAGWNLPSLQHGRKWNGNHHGGATSWKKPIISKFFSQIDHKILRESLELLLSQEDDFTVIGQAENGLELESRFIEEQPDVLLMDISNAETKWI